MSRWNSNISLFFDLSKKQYNKLVLPQKSRSPHTTGDGTNGIRSNY